MSDIRDRFFKSSDSEPEIKEDNNFETNKKIKCNDIRGDIDINNIIYNDNDLLKSNDYLLSYETIEQNILNEINELNYFLNNDNIFKQLNKYLSINILNIDDNKINLILNFYNKCSFYKKYLFSFISDNIKNKFTQYQDYKINFVLIINGEFF